MPRKRKTPTREELRRVDRRRRVAEAWMAGTSAPAIAKAERISVSAVYTDLAAASEVILPAGTKEALLARNYSRLEDIIRANRAGMEKGDDLATRNTTKALAEQNRMLGVTSSGGVSFTVNTGGDGSTNWDIEGSVARAEGSAGRGITFVKPAPIADDPMPEPPKEYGPRLIEYKPSKPEETKPALLPEWRQANDQLQEAPKPIEPPEPMRPSDVPKPSAKSKRKALQERAEVEGWNVDPRVPAKPKSWMR